MKKVLLSLVGGLISMCAFSQLNGTYTINGAQATGGTNYQTFTAAFAALTTNGVSGPVTFNCIQGTYNEQVYLSSASISGTSTTNTITFQAAASNTNEVLWTYSSQPIYWYYCTLSNIKFTGLHFQTSGTYNATIYAYVGTFTNVSFENNIIDGPHTTSTSTSYAAVYTYYTTLINFRVTDNAINYGAAGVSIYYTNYNGASNSEVTINDNTIYDYYYMGIYTYGGSYPYTKHTISGNHLRNDPNSYYYPYGMYVQYAKEASELAGNEIELNQANGGGYGMYIYSPQGTSTNAVKVNNNIIRFSGTSDSYSQYGYMMYYAYYTKVYHNTVKLGNNGTGSYGAYLYYNYNGNEFKNNIIQAGGASSGGAYIYPYSGTFTGYLELDHNAYNQSNSENFRFYNAWTGSVYTAMNTWQSASGQDANSMITDPLFISSSNLTPQSADINNNGAALGITTDFYGNSRSATIPDPGAIEFSVPTNNAQPHILLSPDAPLCSTDTSAVVVIKNMGLVDLTSVHINYSVNSASPTVINWTGSLAPQGLDTVVIAASASYSNGDNVRVWTSLPNGVTDSSALFDTIGLDLFDGLSGTYSIPGDYATLTAARNDLVAKGVCNHVVFNIAPGTYTEQVSFPTILGTSENATVTFQSSTSNANDVTITYASTSSADNYVVQLAGADWFTFNELKMQNTGSSIYASVMSMVNGSSHNTVTDCWLKCGTYGYTGTGNYLSGIYIYGAGNDHNTITNNRIEKGSCSLYCYGGGTSAKIKGLTVENNKLEDSYFYGSYMYYTDDIEFHNNTITNDSAMYYYGYGYMMYYATGFNITGNYIGSDISDGYYYGMYIYYSTGYNNPRSQVANNCIFSGSATGVSYGYYGVYSYNSGIYDFVYNSVNKRGPASGYAGYFLYGGLVTLKNNSFSNFTSSYALGSDAFTIAESDYNNLYSEASSQFYYAGLAYSDLDDWQEVTGFDMHSVQTDPAWATALTCITCNDTLNNSGTVLTTVSSDISGNGRSVSTPDIGATEYVTPATFTLGQDDTICGNEMVVEAGPAQSVVWSVNNVPFTTPSVTINATTAPANFDISVVITTEYCGSASDDVTLRLVPDASLTASEHICADDDITLQPGGGSNATYQWSNGETTSSITVNAPGVYTVTKMEEGCESSAATEVTKSDAVEILDVEPCSDELPLSLDATINAGTSYAWSGGTSVNTAINSFNDAGNYSVTATDSFGCTSSDEFSVVVLETPEADIDQTHSGLIYFFDASNSLYLSSNTTYFWDFGYNGLTGTNVTEMIQYPWTDPSNPVTYTVTLTIDNGCGTDTKVMELTPDPLGIEDITEGSFVLFPNPAKETVRFKLGSIAADQGLAEVVDITGRVVVSQSIASGTTTGELNIGNLASGSYLVRISIDGNRTVNTLIKQ